MRGGGAQQDLAGGVDDLLVSAHLVGIGGQLAEQVARAGGRAAGAFDGAPLGGGARLRSAARGAAAVEEADQAPGLLAAVAQLAVDLAAQLVGGEHVGEQRREDDGDRDGGGGDDRDAAAEAHESVRRT